MSTYPIRLNWLDPGGPSVLILLRCSNTFASLGGNGLMRRASKNGSNVNQNLVLLF